MFIMALVLKTFMTWWRYINNIKFNLIKTVAMWTLMEQYLSKITSNNFLLSTVSNDVILNIRNQFSLADFEKLFSCFFELIIGLFAMHPFLIFPISTSITRGFSINKLMSSTKKFNKKRVKHSASRWYKLKLVVANRQTLGGLQALLFLIPECIFANFTNCLQFDRYEAIIAIAELLKV